jgi:hypothetical protein
VLASHQQLARNAKGGAWRARTLWDYDAPQYMLLPPFSSRVLASTKRRRKILSLVQDALGQLRLDMKYLMFDLEATRRERDDYKRQIEERA